MTSRMPTPAQTDKDQYWNRQFVYTLLYNNNKLIFQYHNNEVNKKNNYCSSINQKHFMLQLTDLCVVNWSQYSVSIFQNWLNP